MLDDIRPAGWAFEDELLDLLWLLDNTVDLLPEINAHFEQILQSDLFQAKDLPKPTAAEQRSKTREMKVRRAAQAGVERVLV